MQGRDFLAFFLRRPWWRSEKHEIARELAARLFMGFYGRF